MTSRFLGMGLAFLAAISLSPSPAAAQGTTPMPLAKAVVSNEVASRTLFKYQINASVARQIVDACVEFANKQQGGPGNYAIFVLAPNGDIIAAHVMDGVVPIGVETGLMKARTALYARTQEGSLYDLDEPTQPLLLVGEGLPLCELVVRERRRRASGSGRPSRGRRRASE